jgi:tetratricopeptide (TPR) repeat protein
VAVSEPALPFGLQLEGGQAALSLERPVWVGYGRIDRLLIRWPDVRYPFDLGARMRQLKRLRGQLAEFEVVISPARLAETLDERAVAKYGITGLEVQSVGPRLQLAFQAEIAGRIAEVTVPVTPVPAPGGRLRLRFDVPRVYGWLPLPAPLLLAGLAAAPRIGGWAGAEPPLVRFPELASWELDVRELILLALLPARGWRLPDRGRVEVAAVAVEEGGLRLRLAEVDAGEPAGAEATWAAEAARLIQDGDAALMAGESRPALEAYRQAAALAPELEATSDRILSLLAVAGDPEALEVEARTRAEAAPREVWPALGHAAAVAERGRQAEAAALYQALADELGRQDEPYDRACALAAAAAALERAGQAEQAAARRGTAIAVLDELGASSTTSLGAGLRGRLSAPARGPGEPADAGADRGGQLGRARIAWQEGRLEESARLHEALLAAPAGDAAAAESHLRLAQWARLQGQVATAARHLTRALRVEPAAGAAVDVLIEVLEAFGRTDELVGILRARLQGEEHEVIVPGTLGGSQTPRDGTPAAKPPPSPHVRRELTRALGAVLERAGRAPEAVALYREGLGRGDDDALTLTRLAEIFRRESRRDELRQVLEPLFERLAEADGGRVVDEVETGVDLETVAVELAALHAEAPAGQQRARQILERALAVRPGAQEARQALEALGAANRPPAGDG